MAKPSMSDMFEAFIRAPLPEMRRMLEGPQGKSLLPWFEAGFRMMMEDAIVKQNEKVYRFASLHANLLSSCDKDGVAKAFDNLDPSEWREL